MSNIRHCGKEPKHPFSGLPELQHLKQNAHWPPPPSAARCRELWEKYGMLENVQRHSELVARIATSLAQRASELNFRVDVAACQAAGLLHDIAKTWCLCHGGSHAMLGAAWTARETGHFGIAQGVILHVHWPWDVPNGPQICSLPFFVIYADKRVKHDVCVSLEERFSDLLERYGKTENARMGIRNSWAQAEIIENILSKHLKWNLHEDSFDRWRLVD